MMQENTPAIRVENLTIGYGDRTILRNLNFTVNRGDIFVIMGPSGCGKSTILKSLIGLNPPWAGKVFFGEESFWEKEESERQVLMRKTGVLYQSGALWSSLTLKENIALPLQLYTNLPADKIQAEVDLRLSLVGLDGYDDFYPSEISGGMRKRAGLARAIVLNPEVIFFDEPSAGLDPVSSQLLDELMLQLRDAMGATLVIVTHELPSIFAVGSNSIFIDAETKTISAWGKPQELLATSKDPKVIQFLTRGKKQGVPV
jgi:phospholipid/cholesterol/gamma-HCH transport system ATP-binding protein